MWRLALGIAVWVFHYFLNKELERDLKNKHRDYWNEIYANWERIRIDASKCDMSVADATITIDKNTTRERTEIEKRTYL